MSETAGRKDLLKRALQRIDELETELGSGPRRGEPLAIVGMGCRFPGGAEDPEAFWQRLLQGFDATGEVPRERFDVDAYYDPTPGTRGRMYTRRGAFLTGPVDRFDPEFFGIAPREADEMDPQQRLLLEVVWEALERGGHAPSRLQGSSTGVFLGMSTHDWAYLQDRGADTSQIDTYYGTGVSHSVAAGRIAYVLGLKGPALTIDTACSSSLVALHEACQSLRAGEVRMAIAGGVSLVLTPHGHVIASFGRMLAPDGRCKTFDAAADGYTRGEGCGVVLLKRLRDAHADGDRVLALVHGTAVNQDGRSAGLTAPNGRAQEEVMRAALEASGLVPADVALIEAHGTGTELGDPIEIQALGAVHASRTNPLYVASVKTNIGHLESAAGIAGIIKTVLTLQHGVIPPHLNFVTPNPHIPWQELPIRVPTQALRWPAEHARRIAGVSSFGFSGTNAHVVLEAAPAAARLDSAEAPAIVALSARTPAALQTLAKRLASRVAADTDLAPRSVAATLATGRSHFEHRAAGVVRSRDELQALLGAVAGGASPPFAGEALLKRPPRVAFLFTGQGAQRPGMGRDLLATEPVFRAEIDKCDAMLTPLVGRSIRSLLEADPEDAGATAALRQTEITQPVLFAVEWALAQLLRSWGVRPAVVLGHSLGEYVAACVAGVFTLEEALRLVAERGRLIGALPAGGAMASVFAPPDSVARVIAESPDRLAIAAFNSPENTVISGDATAVEAALSALRDASIEARPLVVSHAFHSPLMEPVLEQFRAVVAAVPVRTPQIDLIANRSGTKAGATTLDSDYWTRHIREPVRFTDSVASLRAERATVLIELGPAPVLLALARSCPGGVDEEVLAPTLTPGKDAFLSMRETLARLYVAGVPIDWQRVTPGRGTPVALPTYPFQRERHWLPEHVTQRVRRVAVPGEHPLLGQRLESPRLQGVAFESALQPDEPAWISEHVVFGRAVLPAAAFLELARAGAEAAHCAQDLCDVRILEPLVFDGPRRVQTLVDGEKIEIVSRAEGESTWRTHLTACTAAPDDASNPHAKRVSVAKPDGKALDVNQYLARIRAAGVQHLGAFATLTALRSSEHAAYGELDAARIEAAEQSAYGVHPALLDAAFQTCGASFDSAAEGIYVPVGVERFTLLRPAGAHERLLVHARLREDAVSAWRRVCDVELCAANGELLARIEGLQFQRAAAAHDAAERRVREWLYALEWVDAKLQSTSSPPGSWCVIGSGPDAVMVATALQSRGATVTNITAEAVASAGGAWREIVYVPARVALPAAGDGALDAIRPALEPLLELVRTAASSPRAMRLCVVTRAAVAVEAKDEVDPVAAALWGFGQTLGVELPRLGCRRIDLPAGGAEDWSVALAESLLAETAEDRIALRGGVAKVARLARYRDPVRVQARPKHYRLEIAERGQLDRLTFVDDDEHAAPGPEQVRIRVRATGLNFRDVLNALGMYPGDAGPLGSECVGVIEAVGARVTDLRVGDEVMAITPRGFCSRVVADAAMTVRVPAGVSVAGAATIPIAFLTADWALDELGKLSAGERVLIHAGAGGVGMAAIQLARARGAEVFATAGSARKRAALRRLGVQHVYDSRSLAFRDQVLADTAGEGVHVVLNSLANEFIQASFDVLRHDGRFLEIGKTDVWDPEKVRAVRPQTAYHVIYLGDECARRPERVHERFVAVAARFERGELVPLPVKRFRVDEAAAAFRFMAQAKHMGKVVLFDSGIDASALDGAAWITGGLGGLGLAIARSMVDRGVRQIVLSGRTAPSAQALETIRGLEQSSAEVLVLACDVANEESMRAARTAIDAHGLVLRHVVHAAGVLADAALISQDWASFETALAPKVAGVLNLQAVTANAPLESFTLFSAGAGLLGSPGQANYATANTFLDGLAQQRWSQGLPALSIAWGPWADVGMAARSGLDWSHQGLGAIPASEGAAAMWRLQRDGIAYAAVLPIDWTRFPAVMPDGRVRPFFELVAEQRKVEPSAGPDQWKVLLAATPPRQRAGILEQLLSGEVASVLGLDPSRPPSRRKGFTEMGIDSLMAVELANRLSRQLGVSLPSTFVFEQPNLETMAGFLMTMLGINAKTDKHPEPAAESPAAAPAEDRAIGSMSAAEASAALLEELERIGY